MDVSEKLGPLYKIVYLFYVKTIGWENLRAIEKIRFINSMYLWLLVVPVLAKITRYFESPINIVVFQNTFKVDLVLPFSWYLFYFSALFFVLGNISVVLFCPRVIKDQQGLSMRYIKDKGAPVDVLRDYAIELSGKPFDEEDYSDLFELSRKGNLFRPLARILTAILYAVGLALIIYVVYENFLVVLEMYRGGRVL